MCIFKIIDNCNDALLEEILQGPQDKIISILHEINDSHDTPLMVAFGQLRLARKYGENHAIYRARHIVVMLIEAGFQFYPGLLRIPDHDGYTPLAGAIILDEFEILQLLMNDPLLWDTPCYFNLLPLEYAARHGAVDVVIWLVGRGALCRPEMISVNDEEVVAERGGLLALILHRSLRLTPLVTQLIAGIFRDDLGIQPLALQPGARRPLCGEAWTFIAQCVLPAHDRAFAIVVPHLRWTVALHDCLAIAIDVGAWETFNAILPHIRHAQIDMGDLFQLAKLAYARERGNWALDIFHAYIHGHDPMLIDEGEVEPIDRRPDGTPLSNDDLLQEGIIDNVVALYLDDEPTEMESNQILEYFNLDLDDSEALAQLLPMLLNDGAQAFTSLLAIPGLNEDIATDATANILANIVNSNAFYDRLELIVRLPLTEALLSSNVMLAFNRNNDEAALVLLRAGANPTINLDGDILEGNHLTNGMLLRLTVYDFLKQAHVQNLENNALVLKALLLLSHGAHATFLMEDGTSISLVNLAQIDGQLGLVHAFASLGVTPCILFENFIANPNQELVPYVMTAFEGIRECWQRLSAYGFYGRWLFVVAFQGNMGNRLIASLANLGICPLLEPNDQRDILELRDCLAVINLNEPIPLLEQSLLQYNFNTQNLANISFPWNTENSRRLAFSCEWVFRNRERLNPAQLARELTRFRALQSLLAQGVPLAMINRILRNLGR